MADIKMNDQIIAGIFVKSLLVQKKYGAVVYVETSKENCWVIWFDTGQAFSNKIACSNIERCASPSSDEWIRFIMNQLHHMIGAHSHSSK